ncbi:MAG: hypothetical protein JXI43_07785 [Tissierellales bacterium]|nr:hypothetical protein [Tissierellales bacterium]
MNVKTNLKNDIDKKMRESYYFETSAVNFLYDIFSKDDEFNSIKTKNLQISKGRKWYISSATLWEIFKTKEVNKGVKSTFEYYSFFYKSQT